MPKFVAIGATSCRNPSPSAASSPTRPAKTAPAASAPAPGTRHPPAVRGRAGGDGGRGGRRQAAVEQRAEVVGQRRVGRRTSTSSADRRRLAYPPRRAPSQSDSNGIACAMCGGPYDDYEPQDSDGDGYPNDTPARKTRRPTPRLRGRAQRECGHRYVDRLRNRCCRSRVFGIQWQAGHCSRSAFSPSRRAVYSACPKPGVLLMLEGLVKPLLERSRRQRTIVVTLNVLLVLSGLYIASTTGTLATWLNALGF